MYLASNENDQILWRGWIDGCVKCIGHSLRPHFARLFQISPKALRRASFEICEEVRPLFARNGVASYLNEPGKKLIFGKDETVAMKILLTGGSGYIGSVVVQDLIKCGHEVIVFDNLERGHASNVPNEVRLIVGDLKERAFTCDVFSEVRPDAVLHFAAYALVGESMNDPLFYYSNNVNGGINLLEGMKVADCTRLIFSSSCATYGVPRSLPIEEDCSQNPTNPYGQSKLVFEDACRWLWKQGKLRPTFLRYFNAAGAAYGLAERHDPETHIIPNVLRVALGLSPAVKIYGDDYPTADGTCVRDYVHVKDLSLAHVMTLEKEALGAYNLGTGHGVSVREIVDVCRQVTGRTIPVEVCPRRPGDPPALYASGKKARCDLGWEPVCSDLTTIVKDAWIAMQEKPTE